MAQSLAFIGGETFARGNRITFGTLDFLATSTGELHLSAPSIPMGKLH
jgi:hypothetical protein